MKFFILGLLYGYRWFISPFLMPSCKYSPSCSSYAIQAIKLHGVRKGLIITSKRIARCRPKIKEEIYQGHYDPVPKKEMKMMHLNKGHKNA